MSILFAKANVSKQSKEYILEALNQPTLSGDGQFTRQCTELLVNFIKAKDVLLTHSCTAALEMASLLLDLQHKDEIIMPSYGFSSIANSVILRGAIPVFVDIRSDCFNINETKIEEAITNKTKAIYVIHYAGVSCNMDYILSVAKRYNLKVVEDAAQGVGAFYKNKHLGTIGDIGAFSFHATKNIQCGEGGAIILNDYQYISRAEIIREKGTNRKSFVNGEIDKYTWVDIGSSYLPSDLLASLLLGELENLTEITKARLNLWNRYHKLLEPLERQQLLRRPIIPEYSKHNGHIYYVLLPKQVIRDQLMIEFKNNGIQSCFHYIPLHSSPAGKIFGRFVGNMEVTDMVASCILRLPIYPALSFAEQDKIIKVLFSFLSSYSIK